MEIQTLAISNVKGFQRKMDDPDLVERHNRRIVQLKLEYEQTVASAERACGELLAGDLREADESRAYRNALVGERAAMDAYQKAVLGLAEVMLRGGLRTD